jgi:hypothetical protein
MLGPWIGLEAGQQGGACQRRQQVGASGLAHRDPGGLAAEQPGALALVYAMQTFHLPEPQNEIVASHGKLRVVRHLGQPSQVAVIVRT